MAAFLDLFKAFDTLVHNILLERISIRRRVLGRFDSFLKDRKQIVRLGDTLSKPVDNSYGNNNDSFRFQCADDTANCINVSGDVDIFINYLILRNYNHCSTVDTTYYVP